MAASLFLFCLMLCMHRMWQDKRGGRRMIFTNQALALFGELLDEMEELTRE